MSWFAGHSAAQQEALFLKRARGLMLGLALGEALRFADRPRIPVTTGAQLASVTAESIVRWEIRAEEKACHPPAVLWHGLHRWAYGRGELGDEVIARWRSGTESSWPDGWLHGTSATSDAEGSSPTTISALRGARMGTPAAPTNTSDSYQCLVRTLPLAIAMPELDTHTAALVRDCAALTHGATAGLDAAVTAVEILGNLLRSQFPLDTPGLVGSAVRSLRFSPTATADKLSGIASGSKGDSHRLRQLASDATAAPVLAAGLYAANSARTGRDVPAALDLTLFSASQSKGVGAVAGALIGAAHGPDVFDPLLLSRLDIAWIVDALAHDVVNQLFHQPGGVPLFMVPSGTDGSTRPDQSGTVTDPNWRTRYPGW